MLQHGKQVITRQRKVPGKCKQLRLQDLEKSRGPRSSHPGVIVRLKFVSAGPRGGSQTCQVLRDFEVRDMAEERGCLSQMWTAFR